VHVIIARSLASDVGTRIAPHRGVKAEPLYEVWMSHGVGLEPGPKFKNLDDACRFIDQHTGEASFAIRTPQHTWTMIRARRRLARGSLYR